MEEAIPEDFDPTLKEYVKSSELAKDYDEYFAGSPLFDFDQRYVAASLRFPRKPGENFSLLDLGCGTGRHMVLAAKNGCRATGVDLNSHMLAKARAKLARSGIPCAYNPAPGSGDPVRLFQAGIENPPLLDTERFDAIVMMFSTLGLVFGKQRREVFMRKIASRLKPGGRLIVHVHNELHARKHIPLLSAAFMEEIALGFAGKLDPGDHMQRGYRGILDLRLHYFTSKELRMLLEGAGLKIVDFLYLNEDRDGECLGRDRECDANGFLVTATI